ncbi:MAG: Two-component system sensor histidine kinase, partial [uncultured Solirubrobacteraceae bacterium]
DDRTPHRLPPAQPRDRHGLVRRVRDAAAAGRRPGDHARRPADPRRHAVPHPPAGAIRAHARPRAARRGDRVALPAPGTAGPLAGDPGAARGPADVEGLRLPDDADAARGLLVRGGGLPDRRPAVVPRGAGLLLGDRLRRRGGHRPRPRARRHAARVAGDVGRRCADRLPGHRAPPPPRTCRGRMGAAAAVLDARPRAHRSGHRRPVGAGADHRGRRRRAPAPRARPARRRAAAARRAQPQARDGEVQAVGRQRGGDARRGGARGVARGARRAARPRARHPPGGPHRPRPAPRPGGARPPVLGAGGADRRAGRAAPSRDRGRRLLRGERVPGERRQVLGGRAGDGGRARAGRHARRRGRRRRPRRGRPGRGVGATGPRGPRRRARRHARGRQPARRRHARARRAAVDGQARRISV